ncbi:MAG TPA: AAA family ATPase [Rhizomicrobium sp.]|jgi:energy-coupling factor transporter ATP-binding protein EcfA2
MSEDGVKFDRDIQIDAPNSITRFEVKNLFLRNLTYTIEFPASLTGKGEPSLLILSGPNGGGKTTILRMIDGMLNWDFDLFRRVPFERAALTLSSGDRLEITKTQDKAFPLFASFGGNSAFMSAKKGQGYPQDKDAAREHLRELALPVLKTVKFELLDIHRSIALRSGDLNSDEVDEILIRSEMRRRGYPEVRDLTKVLSSQVKRFVQEAQVNYRKYFEAEQLALLPRILNRLEKTDRPTKDALRVVLEKSRESAPMLKRMGLYTDDQDETDLIDLLSNNERYEDPASLAVFEAYVEMQQNKAQTRALIANRLENFERIMAEFLDGKVVQIDAKSGLKITAGAAELSETSLSSGEYHFLCMMVTALLCLRAGTIIAIDEPEMSLHVTWQRKVVDALTLCAAGASPLFVFATHSSAISAEHSDRVVKLGTIE